MSKPPPKAPCPDIITEGVGISILAVLGRGEVGTNTQFTAESIDLFQSQQLIKPFSVLSNWKKNSKDRLTMKK